MSACWMRDNALLELAKAVYTQVFGWTYRVGSPEWGGMGTPLWWKNRNGEPMHEFWPSPVRSPESCAKVRAEVESQAWWGGTVVRRFPGKVQVRMYTVDGRCVASVSDEAEEPAYCLAAVQAVPRSTQSPFSVPKSPLDRRSPGSTL